MARVLIAGMGNILQQDDGFGVEVAQRLALRQSQGYPPLATVGVRVTEVGIGGIHLVQELMDGYDVLVLVDAVEQGSEPGTVHVLQTDVADLDTWTEEERQDFLADMHYATPSRALILAKALNVLPTKVYIVGCQPAAMDDLGIGLSPTAERAAGETITRIEQIVSQEIGRTEPAT
jgi:hydrogenase maturation protease